jgi:hypothetical protein
MNMQTAVCKILNQLNSKNVWMTYCALLAALILLPYAEPARAQLKDAIISGTVVDSAGAMVSGAEIEVKNKKTQALDKTISAETGVFLMERLPAGKYDLKVSRFGFRPFMRQGIKIQSGQILQVRVVLEARSMKKSKTLSRPVITKMRP